MIYTFLADISRLDTEAVLNHQNQVKKSCGVFEKSIKKTPCGKIDAPKMGEEIIAHILSGKDRQVQHERCGAYLILSAIMTEMFGGMLYINREKNGKPYFDRSSGVKFSISHSSNAVAVAISTDDCVGVDIQGEIDQNRAERLERRFFSELAISDRYADVIYMFCVLEKNGDIEFYPLSAENKCSALKNKAENFVLQNAKLTDSFSAKWTLYEATMKCDGGGFTSLPCLGMLLLETKANIKKVCINGETYYVSTVINA